MLIYLFGSHCCNEIILASILLKWLSFDFNWINAKHFFYFNKCVSPSVRVHELYQCKRRTWNSLIQLFVAIISLKISIQIYNSSKSSSTCSKLSNFFSLFIFLQPNRINAYKTYAKIEKITEDEKNDKNLKNGKNKKKSLNQKQTYWMKSWNFGAWSQTKLDLLQWLKYFF